MRDRVQDRPRLAPHAARDHAPALEPQPDPDADAAPAETYDGRESYILPAPDIDRYLDELRALGFEF